VRRTGNPVRLPPGSTRNGIAVKREARPRLLILGGSGGSGPLNRAVPGALARLASHLPGWRVLHQAGRGAVEPVRDRYAKLGLSVEVEGFLPDLPDALSDADLAICRAGGTTLAELAATGVPAATVPFARAADDHQRRNAEVFAAAGACLLVDERADAESLDERLSTALRGLLSGPARRAAMAASMRRLAQPRAAGDVAGIVLDLAKPRPVSSAVRPAA
jgi:UDP-N-acetylglucosamine--N-acetylmuramyl-(pentapeptide) pyrophosphoryl-undecaprenol N-acetylglucosamine transferase